MAEKENEKKKKNTAKKTTQNKKTAAKKPAAKKTTNTKNASAKKSNTSKTKKTQNKKPVAKQPVKKPEVKKAEPKETKKEEALEKTIIFDGRQNKNLAEVVEKLEEKNVVLDDKVVKRSKAKKIAIVIVSLLMVAVVVADIVFIANYYKREKENNLTTTSNVYDKVKRNYNNVDDIKVEDEKKTTKEGEEVYKNIKTITVKEFEEKSFQKENMVVLVSSSTCYHCITFEPTVDKVFKSLKKTIYRIDVASTNQQELDRFRTYYAFTVTPTIFVVKDGVVTADSTGSINEENLTKWLNENL